MAALVQPELVWEDRDANLNMLDEMMLSVPDGTDVIILPETFSTGFTMESEQFAEEVNGKAVTWIQKTAQQMNARICGSLIIRENGRIYNRAYWVSPAGVEGYYDKRHLFRMGREEKHFTAGSSRMVFELGEARFLLQICYDLRFPVFSRNRNDYDILCYMANWPAPRQPVWNALLKARAIENQAYVLGVNRVGIDGEGVDHLGETGAWDPLGNRLLQMDHHPGIGTVELNMKWLREYRIKFPAWKDADRFSIDL